MSPPKRADALAGDAQFTGTRALVVDDEPDLREMVATFLSMFGMVVDAASSGDEAFTRFTEHRPDIIISDIHMPSGSGLDLIRRIRALPPDRGGLTPAIAGQLVPAMDPILACLAATRAGV